MTRSALLFANLVCAAGFVLGPALAADAVSSASGAPGLGLDANAPIAVNADSFAADLKGESGTYSGNVIVTQGNMKLHADKVTVLAPGGKATRMEASGHVVVDSTSGTAIGDTATYDVAARAVNLTGHVVLTKGSNVMRGTALQVEMATGKARLTGGVTASGQQQSQGRVQGLFTPTQKSGDSER